MIFFWSLSYTITKRGLFVNDAYNCGIRSPRSPAQTPSSQYLASSVKSSSRLSQSPIFAVGPAAAAWIGWSCSAGKFLIIAKASLMTTLLSAVPPSAVISCVWSGLAMNARVPGKQLPLVSTRNGALEVSIPRALSMKSCPSLTISS